MFAMMTSMKPKEIETYITANKHNHAFVSVLIGMFHPDIKWLLPPVPPKDDQWKPNVYEYPYGIHNNYKRFYLFQEGTKVTLLKMQQLFIQLLEEVNIEDAKLLISMVTKKSPIAALTYDLVKKALPEHFSNG